jgi:hypothetical protein
MHVPMCIYYVERERETWSKICCQWVKVVELGSGDGLCCIALQHTDTETYRHTEAYTHTHTHTHGM